ncbi:hypothetical protein BGX34_003359 [Mortierella sp. NVP85]|nr:hypothetical protein BGX34_003359 [Mortierella sp. NVP85]
MDMSHDVFRELRGVTKDYLTLTCAAPYAVSILMIEIPGAAVKLMQEHHPIVTVAKFWIQFYMYAYLAHAACRPLSPLDTVLTTSGLKWDGIIFATCFWLFLRWMLLFLGRKPGMAPVIMSLILFYAIAHFGHQLTWIWNWKKLLDERYQTVAAIDGKDWTDVAFGLLALPTASFLCFNSMMSLVLYQIVVYGTAFHW